MTHGHLYQIPEACFVCSGPPVEFRKVKSSYLTGAHRVELVLDLPVCRACVRREWIARAGMLVLWALLIGIVMAGSSWAIARFRIDRQTTDNCLVPLLMAALGILMFPSIFRIGWKSLVLHLVHRNGHTLTPKTWIENRHFVTASFGTVNFPNKEFDRMFKDRNGAILFDPRTGL